jgi:hypothetical protein
MTYSCDLPGNQQQFVAALRSQLNSLRARYDYGAVAPNVYAVIVALETEIAWTEHQQGARP